MFNLGGLLFVTSNRTLLPPSIVHVNPNPSYNATVVVLGNYFSRQFDSESLNVHVLQ